MTVETRPNGPVKKSPTISRNKCVSKENLHPYNISNDCLIPVTKKGMTSNFKSLLMLDALDQHQDGRIKTQRTFLNDQAFEKLEASTGIVGMTKLATELSTDMDFLQLIN